MSLYLIEDLIWYRATTLAERLSAGPSCHATEPPAEDDLARYRWQSWKSQPPFDEEAAFAQRLAWEGLTEMQWRHLVAEPLAALRGRFPEPPAWLHDLQRALAQPCALDLRQLLSDKWQREPALGFLHAAAPFIAQALARFEAGVAALTTNAAELPFDPATIRQLCFANLPNDLLAILSRTMALELNIARLSGELEGDTPEARFQSFIERLQQPERRHALLREYPVLARLLSEQAQRWVEVSLEFLTRLCRDWAEIKATFAPEREPGVLVKVKGGLTDTQRGGRTIFIAKFSSGRRLVYKPKPLAVDAHFQELLQWLNDRGADPPFPLLTVLNRENYGWVEFVSARACETAEEVHRFYRRQGSYLALLYLIEATDFHSANLIAAGEHPYLIDLEALFHPRRSRTTDDATDPADKLAGRVLAHSVLRIGLLPRRSWGNSEHVGIDRSGLGMTEGQMTPHALPHWEGKGTDSMHLVRQRAAVSMQKNRPKLADVPVNVLDYRAELEDGFVATYKLLLAHRDELQAEEGPLTRFAEDEVCVFLRSSRTYRRLLEESYHPDVLRDALDRDRLFDALWVEVADDAALAGVMRAERAELQAGDTPLFTTRPHSPDLRPYADARIPDFFAEASLTTVRRRIGQLSLADCARQAWFIRASLATMPTAEPPLQAVPPTASELSRESSLAAARTIGDRLEALAFRGPDDASWLGLMQEPGRAWFIDSLGFDLDAGLPGVVLFLAQLGARTGEDRYTALAAAALTTMQRQIAERGEEVTMIGAFDGWGGVIYTLTQLGVLWQRPDLIAEAEAVVNRLPELIAEDDKFDVYGGAAGCLAGLHCLFHIAPSEPVAAAAIQCGDHLLAKGSEAKPGPGFARGTTGIAWALRMLYDWTGLERFRVAEVSSEWEAQVRAQEEAMLAAWTPHGWRCGTPLAVETPGLLTGLAGIGYELLRVAEPELVPSVLTLELPARRLEGERRSRHD
jgi:type 2 lantibiotic biosynthesis protein LanM